MSLKNLLITISSVTLISIIVVSYVVWDIQQFDQQLDDELFTVSFENEQVNVRHTSTQTRSWEFGSDTVNRYNLVANGRQVAEAIITKRSLGDGGYYFVEINKKDDYDGSFTITYNLKDVTKWHSFSDLNYDVEHNPTTGRDFVKGPYGVFETQSGGQLLVGRAIKSHQLKKEYDDGHVSVVQVFDEQLEGLISNTDDEPSHNMKIDLELNDDHQQFSMYFMYSKGKDLIPEADLDQFGQQLAQHYEQIHKWITPQGVYAKLPWSIEPKVKLGYGRNVGMQFRMDHVERYHDKGYLYDYVSILNSLAMVDVMRNEFSQFPLIPTEYTSTWLQKPYGLHAPYMDTRHHENLGHFYLAAQEITGIDFQNEFLIYANYLATQLYPGRVIEAGDGALITDYNGPGLDRVTHASLNHVLAEMYYLLTAYFITDEETYLETAYTIRQGLEFIGEDWIRPNGDLWYQVNSDLTFSGEDYPCLTIVDLKENIEAWSKTRYGEFELLETLLNSKQDAGVCTRPLD